MKWTDKEEDFLQLLEKQADQLSVHYNKEYLYYKRLATKFNVPILIVSAINSLTAIALNDFVPQRYVSILNAVLSAGTGVMGSIQLYLKINEKMANSLKSAGAFKKLALKLSKELSLERDERDTDGKIFLNDCFAEFNTDLEQSNPIERKLANHMRLTRDDDQEKKSLGELLLNLKNGSPRSDDADSV
jgi:hypothetical protein